MVSHRPLAYRVGPFDPKHGDMRNAAFLQCSECPYVGKVPLVGIGNVPEIIEKRFIRLGWDANVHKPTECFCPKCVRQRRIRKGNDIALVDITRAPGLRDALKEQALSPPKPVSSPKEVKLAIKDLSPEQKTMLRNELGGTFDESTGRYLENNSDHAISEKLGIPRATVIEFREAFYGELKDDPEVTAFRMQLADAKRILANLEGTIEKMESKLALIAKRIGV